MPGREVSVLSVVCSEERLLRINKRKLKRFILQVCSVEEPSTESHINNKIVSLYIGEE